MAEFLTSDLHLGHRKAAEEFKRDNGTPLRPFGTLAETDRQIIERINSTCSPSDTLYILGDIGWTSQGFGLLSQLNPRLVAVLGNHDRNKIEEYRSVFSEVHGALNRHGLLLTHIPVHPSCVGRYGLNVHGHLHSGCILDSEGKSDPQYLCASVERWDFRPFPIEIALAIKQNLRGAP
ncbi:COG4186 Predicted phosphoesterase or phosphohydrolase [uncultured Caudovirales phage]|uniref:COG4186 Predicted phosphoesterase or phosphohydrolase n=1 Tax=uncultured Caudovirales phage TaxID=2100421 RepID=A0A6J5KR34_9CAUD|nr:COG4186 Predicted phosphoesterase or phosphohydrolase [uncultured Caudovirales phage]